MATLVKFYREKDYAQTKDVFAYFPQLNYNKRLYGTAQKMCYAHVGQHSGCHVDYMKECNPAKKKEYTDLLAELKRVGYTDLKVLNK